MIILICIVIGLALRAVTGRSLRGLAESRLRGESLLLILLISQAALPFLQLTGAAGRVAFFVWLGTFPCMVTVAWMNRREPGMPMLGIGLLLNLVVIATNGGMPVFEVAVHTAGASAQTMTVPAGDFVHVAGSAATLLSWLGDIIPLVGPAWLRIVASPGDLLLFAGIVAFVGSTAPRARRSPSILSANESRRP